MTATEAETLDFVRDRVAHVVGHEMRTPITTVRGLAELMTDATDEEIRETLVPALLRNARRAERLLDDLLLAAEVRTVRSTAPVEVVDLGEVVTEATAASAIRVSGWPDGRVLATRESVLRALGHLVSNADNYGDGPTTMVFGSDEATVSAVVITPVDVEVADLDLAFELFFRGERAVTRTAGLGVGLAAAKALAQLDGGDVTLTQDNGEVRAELRLPRAP